MMKSTRVAPEANAVKALVRSRRSILIQVVTRPAVVIASFVFLAVFALQLVRAQSALLSPYDEANHLSYIQYMSHLHLPHQGDPLNTWGREAFSCHEVFTFGKLTDVPCGRLAAPTMYPEGGQNTAAGWPPIFYGLAAPAVRAMVAVGIDPLGAARTFSGLVWAFGAAFLVMMSLRFGANKPAAAAAGLLAGAIPAALPMAAVTPHSASLFLAVALSSLALETVRRNELSLGLIAALVLLPIISVLTVPQSILGVGIAYVAIPIGLLLRRRSAFLSSPLVMLRAARTALVTIAIGAGLAGLSYVGWSWLVVRRGSAESAAILSAAQSLVDPRGGSVGKSVLDHWWYFWPGALSGDNSGFGAPERFLASGFVVLSVMAVGISLQRPAGRWDLQALAAGIVIASPLGAFAFQQMLPFLVPLRYGASVVGADLLLVACTWRQFSAQYLLLPCAGLAFCAGFFMSWP